MIVCDMWMWLYGSMSRVCVCVLGCHARGVAAEAGKQGGKQTEYIDQQLLRLLLIRPRAHTAAANIKKLPPQAALCQLVFGRAGRCPATAAALSPHTPRKTLLIRNTNHLPVCRCAVQRRT